MNLPEPPGTAHIVAQGHRDQPEERKEAGANRHLDEIRLWADDMMFGMLRVGDISRIVMMVGHGLLLTVLRLHGVAVDEIEQGEQKDPDDIDKVPIQAEVFYRSDIPATELPSIGPPRQPAQQYDADDHVERVHSSHREVEREENLRLLRHIGRERLLGQLARLGIYRRVDELRNVKVRARDVVLLPLLVILNVLDAKEDQAQQGGDDKEEDEKTLLPDLGCPDSHRHKEARSNQHSSIERPERDAELVGSCNEGLVVPVAVEQVGEEQATEEHDFGQQEEPHAEGSGFALLLLRLEVMTVLGKRDVGMLLRHGGLVGMGTGCH